MAAKKKTDPTVTKTFTAKCQILHDGVPYEEGESIVLTDEAAESLLACGAIVGPVGEAES